MGQKAKLLARLLSRPADFSFDELITLLGSFGYSLARAGKTGGSRVVFTNEKNEYIRLHRPHPRNILKLYQIDDVIAVLRERKHV